MFGVSTTIGKSIRAFLFTMSIVILAGNSTVIAQTRPSNIGLQPMVESVSRQLWFAYRDNLPEFRHRHEQLRATIEAWNNSPQSAADRQLLADWLHEVVQHSMPGSVEALPPLPEFGQVASDLQTNQHTTNYKPAVDEIREAEENALTAEESRSVLKEEPDDPAIDQRLSGESIFDEPKSAAAPAESSDTPAQDLPPADLPGGNDATNQAENSGVQPFWMDHPATHNLPSEMSGTPTKDADPFQDDQSAE